MLAATTSTMADDGDEGEDAGHDDRDDAGHDDDTNDHIMSIMLYIFNSVCEFPMSVYNAY